ncbi:MAG: HAD domain-containing protein [Burkholderiales bacterium]
MILFLDFDGVLHPEPCLSKDWFERLPLFEHWMRRHAQIDLVISSNWRNVVPWRDIVERFSRDIQERIIGHTPPRADVVESLVPAEILIFEREAEIFDWRRTRGRLSEPWIAVDDYPWWFSHGCANLVVIDPATGITAKDLATLSQRIGVINAAKKT